MQFLKFILITIFFTWLSGCASVNNNSFHYQSMNAGTLATEKNQTVYRNTVLGLSLKFPSGWEVITGKQFDARMRNTPDSPAKNILRSRCKNSLVCAIYSPETYRNATIFDVSIIDDKHDENNMSSQNKFYDEIVKDLQPLQNGKDTVFNNAGVVSIHGREFLHLVLSQTRNNLQQTMDMYVLYCSTYGLGFVTSGLSDHVSKDNLQIVQSFYNIPKEVNHEKTTV